MNKTTLRTIIILTIVLLVSAIMYFTWSFTAFRVTTTAPKDSEVTLGTSSIDFTFNRDLEAVNYVNNVDDPEKIVTGISVREGKIISLELGELTEKNYSLSLKNIRSKNGESIQRINFNFTPKFIQFNDLSEAERKRQIDETNRNQFDSPLAEFLPHETDKYKITYKTADDSVALPETITITMKFFEPGDNALPATPAEKQQYIQDIRKYRTEALDYLKKNNVDINKYVMVYTEPELRNEFPSGFQAVQY